MNQKIKRACAFVVGGIVLLLPLVAYALNFWGCKISDDPNDWASFGSYVGGVYSIIVSILVIFIGRKVAKKDKVREERRGIIQSLYEQIKKICDNNINLNSVNKLYTDASKNQLFISETTFKKVLDIADYFQEVKNGEIKRDFDIEKRMLTYLKDLYDE